MNRIDIAIKKPYYDAIRRGYKDTEYREMSDYWMQRLLEVGEEDLESIREDIVYNDKPFKCRPIEVVSFHCNGKSFDVEFKGIEVYHGLPFFAIKLGKKQT